MWSLFKRRSQSPVASNQNAAAKLPGQWRFSMALLTDTGCLRAANEDAGRLLYPNPSVPDGKGLLAVVADGMGGHSAGDRASQLTVETVSRVYFEEPGRSSDCLVHAVMAANAVVYEAASTDNRLSGMGTTCTALALAGGFAYCAHVGDSRLYLLRAGKMYQLTEDHTHVMELVRRGVIDAEQAKEHPERNVLHRAVGRHASLEVDSWPQGASIRSGDCYLLCSDGLSSILPDTVIAQVALERDPQAACAELIHLTRRAGAPDNITVSIVKVDSSLNGHYELPPTREFESEMPPRENEEDGTTRR